jgi:hypothetical protein
MAYLIPFCATRSANAVELWEQDLRRESQARDNTTGITGRAELFGRSRKTISPTEYHGAALCQNAVPMLDAAKAAVRVVALGRDPTCGKSDRRPLSGPCKKSKLAILHHFIVWYQSCLSFPHRTKERALVQLTESAANALRAAIAEAESPGSVPLFLREIVRLRGSHHG